jgi:RNA polymerase sigma factor (sigma-70 family)
MISTLQSEAAVVERVGSGFGAHAMAQLVPSGTRVTLLERLRLSPCDPTAWSEFVNWYGQRIYVWCRTWGLQASDADDVTQEVFLKLSARMSEFRYDPTKSFRAWLRTVTHHTWQDCLCKKKRLVRVSRGDSDLRALADVETRDDLSKALDRAADQELLNSATALVQLRVEPRTWEAFRLLAIEGISGAEAAKQLRMKVATVFVARSKVQRMLREEVARLDHA